MSTLTIDKYNKTKEAIEKITFYGYRVNKISNNELHFSFKGKNIIYYPKKEWATGATIEDCRGLGNLLKQIKPYSILNELGVSDIKNKLIESIKDAKERLSKCKDNEYSIRFEASIDSFQFILDFIEGKQ